MLTGLGAIPSPKMSSSGSAAAEVAPPPPAGVKAKPPVVTPPGPFGVLPNRSSSKSASALLVLADDIGVVVVAPPFIAFMLFPFIDVEFEREKLSMRFSSPLMAFATLTTRRRTTEKDFRRKAAGEPSRVERSRLGCAPPRRSEPRLRKLTRDLNFSRSDRRAHHRARWFEVPECVPNFFGPRDWREVTRRSRDLMSFFLNGSHTLAPARDRIHGHDAQRLRGSLD